MRVGVVCVVCGERGCRSRMKMNLEQKKKNWHLVQYTIIVEQSTSTLLGAYSKKKHLGGVVTP